jgi:hypothetical protein
VQHTQGGAAEGRIELPEVSRKAQEADGLCRQEMSERNLAGIFGTAQELRQTLGAIKVSQAVGQVDPVPGLFELVLGVSASEMVLEDAAGVIGAKLGEGTHLDDELCTGAEAGLGGLDFAALQQGAEAYLGGFDGIFVELSALEKIDMLARDRGNLVGTFLAALEEAAEQERGSKHHRQQYGY